MANRRNSCRIAIHSGRVVSLRNTASTEAAPVAQLDSASPSEGEGYRFEPCRVYFSNSFFCNEFAAFAPMTATSGVTDNSLSVCRRRKRSFERPRKCAFEFATRVPRARAAHGQQVVRATLRSLARCFGISRGLRQPKCFPFQIATERKPTDERENSRVNPIRAGLLRQAGDRRWIPHDGILNAAPLEFRTNG